MATTPQKNIEIVSAQEKVKSKKDQMLENLKLEMLRDLKLDEKLAQRNAVMEKISEARKNNIFPTQIYFGGKEVEIKEQGKYKIIIAQYKKAQTEEEYKQLDKELAEQIILDQGKMIEFSSTEQFEGKTAEEEAKNAFERLEKNDKYNKKIELIKKTDGEATHFIIKRTKKQLEELERAERAYEETYEAENKKQKIVQGATAPQKVQKPVNKKNNLAQNALRDFGIKLKQMKIGEIIELPMVNGFVRLQKEDEYGWKCLTNTVDEFTPYIDKDHYVEHDGNRSYISYVTDENLGRFLKIPMKKPVVKETRKQKKTLPIHNKEEQKLLPPHPEQKLLPPHPEQKLLPPHIEPAIEPIIEPVVEEGLGPVELTATISDTTQITRAIAERQAGEKLRKIYKNTARYKPRSWPTKATLFLGRGYMKDHYTRKFMNMQAGMQRDENLVKGADRHEMEEENKFNEKIENVGNIDEANYPRTYQALDTLAKQLTGDANTLPNPWQKGISDTLFQQQFKAIIRRNLDTNKPTTAIEPPTRKPIAEIIKDNDIQQMSSNITEKLNAFRDHQEMADAIANRIVNNPTESDASFNAFSRDRIIKYFKTYKKNPEFLKTLNIKLDDATAMKELRRLQSHNGALTQIAAQTMRLKVQILTKGEEAYNIKQEGGGMTKIGNRLDKPISDTSRFGKWLEKHPFSKNAFGTLRGVTKLGVMITPAILLAPLGPLAIASGAGGMAAIKTLFKKYAHYNKEHIGYQRNQAVNLLQNSQERERLMNEMTNINPAKRFMLYYFGLGKKARDVRQFRDYVMTTHDQLEDSKSLVSNIEGLLKKPELTLQEQQDLEKYISAGLARLDHHKKTGQNFLGSQDKDRAEKEYQNIHRLVLTGSMRLNKELGDEQNPTAGTLRENNYYDDEMNLINNGTGDEVDQIGYQKSRKRFKSRQTEKALLGAVKAGGVAFGLSYLATSLASNKASTDTLSGNQKVGDNFLLGKHELAGDNQVYTQSKGFFGNAQSGHQTINFNYGGGTDATPVIGGHLNQAEYISKMNEVHNNILQMNNLSTTTKTNLINELNRKPREQVRAEKGFTNDYLQGMRCGEIIEQTAKGLNESGANAGNITLQAAYDGSVYDIVGHTYKNAGERVAQGALDYSQTITTQAQFVPIPVPAYMNTFKEADKYGEERQNNEERQGRKTRSPAPKREKQSTNDIPPRRRSGEDTETPQFTHTNN